MKLIGKYKEALNNACFKYKVDALYAFGSVLTDKFNQKSDLDFIVSIKSVDPLEYAENYFDLKFELEKIFNRKIDLLELRAIKNKVFEQIINKDKKLVYASSDQSVA